jgi:hypothetical protein
MPVDELIAYLRDRAGDALRVVSWYAEDDWGTLYVRDDLDRREVAARVDYVAHQLSDRVGDAADHPLAAMGREQAMVQVREDAVVIRFAIERGAGLLVSLDAVVARDLHGFVVECSELLGGDDVGMLAGTSRRSKQS